MLECRALQRELGMWRAWMAHSWSRCSGVQNRRYPDMDIFSCECGVRGRLGPPIASVKVDMHAPSNEPHEVSSPSMDDQGSSSAPEDRRELGALAAKIAHDFNNILAVFALPLEAMRLNPGGLDPAQLRQILERGAAYAEDLSQRIGDLARTLNGESADEEA
jgi:hypothetical protein